MILVNVAAMLVFAVIVPLKAQIAPGFKEKLDGLTGNKHTRIVWVRGGIWHDPNNHYGIDRYIGENLMGYDSKTGQVHKIAGPFTDLRSPHLHNNGTSVIFTAQNTVYTVDFMARSAPREILRISKDRRCTDVWLDPATSEEWAVIERDTDISRFKISDPTQRVVLYSKPNNGGNSNHSFWQISGDGAMAIAQLPWAWLNYITPGANPSNPASTGEALTLNGKNNGCIPTVTKDNSRVWAYFPFFPHDRVRTVRDKNVIADVWIKDAPTPLGWWGNCPDCGSYYNPNDFEAGHLKFASNAAGAKFILATTGYWHSIGGQCADVAVGKFNDTYTAIQWLKFIQDVEPCEPGKTFGADIMPDMWVGVVENASSQLTNVYPAADKNTIQPNESLRLRVVATDASGNPVTVGNVVWTVSGGGTLSSKSDTAATFLSNGTVGEFSVTITAGGKQGSLAIAVTAEQDTGGPTQQYIKVLKPRGGEIFAAGDIVQVEFEGSAGVFGCIVEYSTDEGYTWNTMVTGSVNLDNNKKGAASYLLDRDFFGTAEKLSVFIRVSDYQNGAINGETASPVSFVKTVSAISPGPRTLRESGVTMRHDGGRDRAVVVSTGVKPARIEALTLTGRRMETVDLPAHASHRITTARPGLLLLRIVTDNGVAGYLTQVP